MAKPIDIDEIRLVYAGVGDPILGHFADDRLFEFNTVLAAHDAEVLNEAADKIQALHPGEAKASVEFLRALAREKTEEWVPYEEPAPEENFWDDRTTPGAYGKSDSDRDMKAIEVLAAFLTKAGLNEKRARTLAHGAVMSKALRVEAI